MNVQHWTTRGEERMQVEFETVVKKRMIPRPIHSGGRSGGRGKHGQFHALLERLKTIGDDEAVKFTHDAPSCQVLHGRIRMATLDADLPFNIKLTVRGNTAYLSKEAN